MKMNNLTDSTDSCIVKQLLKGMSKTYKRADIRRPITVEILADIISNSATNMQFDIRDRSYFFLICSNDFSALAYTFHVFSDKEFSTKLTKSSLKGSKIPWELC
jgi:hypothetical protein